jgi:hypothetical protein
VRQREERQLFLTKNLPRVCGDNNPTPCVICHRLKRVSALSDKRFSANKSTSQQTSKWMDNAQAARYIKSLGRYLPSFPSFAYHLDKSC